MTRTKRRKLQEENQIDTKKTTVVHVLLEKQISTSVKPLEDPIKRQVREQLAVKRKEIHLKCKVDQKYLKMLLKKMYLG